MGSFRQRIAERARSIRWCHSSLLVTAISAGAVAGGCSSNSAVTTAPTQLKCQVALAASSSSIGPDGGTGIITVTTSPECPWDVSTGATWLSGLSPASGQGTGTVEFRAAPNPLPSVREGEIVVNENRLRVSQQAAACVYQISSTSPSVLPSGGADVSASVTAASGCAWTASSSVAWFTVIAGASGTGNGSVAFRVAANPGGVRTGTVTVAGQTFTVTQAAAAVACTYTISPTSVSMDEKRGDGTVNVSAGTGCAWTARSNANWITVERRDASGSGSGSVAFSVTRNSGAVRTGTVTIAGHTFTVRQDKGD
jgi:hypothetical protein